MENRLMRHNPAIVIAFSFKGASSWKNLCRCQHTPHCRSFVLLQIDVVIFNNAVGPLLLGRQLLDGKSL